MDIYTKDAINNKLTKKQDTLVSGTNIKTINGNSLLGSGDVVISGSGASVSSADYASANTQLNGLTIDGTNYKLLDIKVNDGSNLIIGKNRSLASGASKAVAIGDCSSSTVSGGYSTAIGYNSVANNDSTAIGNSSKASGSGSTALGNNSTASGSHSTAIGTYSTASGSASTALGDSSEVYVLNWVGFDGASDDLVRTVSLKSTDNVFFRNENIKSFKTTQESYTSGKTLTQVLNEKQDTLVSGTNIKTINGNSLLGSGDVVISGSGDKLVRINITGISDETAGNTNNSLTFVGFYNETNTALANMGLDLDTLSSNWKTLMTGENAGQLWMGLHGFILAGLWFGCSYKVGDDNIVSPIINLNYLGYIILNGTTPVGHIVFDSETTLKAAFADSTMTLND